MMTEKLFRLKADVTFYAKDIDDALERLSALFSAPFQADFFESGEIEVRPLGGSIRMVTIS